MAKHATPSLTCPVNGCKIPVDAILVSAEGVRRGAHLTLLRTFDPELTVIKPEDRRQLAVAKLPERSHILGLLMKLSHNRPHTNLSTRSPDTIFELVGAAENELAKTSPENAARVMLYRASHGDYKSIDTLARRTMEIPLSDVFRLSKSYSEAYGTYTLYREHWHESMRSYNTVQYAD
ncbi:hypothetical protein VNI00_003749 [Paramarasmius palmivorus]|uniref:Uncharacterized protein n=1 Tax=Paramarasmius palmivorus TaxID=297713 RepID=A0AAW0DRL4_9AGAR